jgi:hypothetical protein
MLFWLTASTGNFVTVPVTNLIIYTGIFFISEGEGVRSCIVRTLMTLSQTVLVV